MSAAGASDVAAALARPGDRDVTLDADLVGVGPDGATRTAIRAADLLAALDLALAKPPAPLL